MTGAAAHFGLKSKKKEVKLMLKIKRCLKISPPLYSIQSDLYLVLAVSVSAAKTWGCRGGPRGAEGNRS